MCEDRSVDVIVVQGWTVDVKAVMVCCSKCVRTER